MASSRSLPTTRVVIFDIRGASPRDSRFQAAAQVSFELIMMKLCIIRAFSVKLVIIYESRDHADDESCCQWILNS